MRVKMHQILSGVELRPNPSGSWIRPDRRGTLHRLPKPLSWISEETGKTGRSKGEMEWNRRENSGNRMEDRPIQ